ncbi:helix-turn-helix transcriptional regulator [Paractinoplanes atraurantiacus]|uniref:Helix-turn-helix domain-containing protein n=1 Tax=Paractinoplanes atraurantiacus TaxID=1036182 RepID=A0A285KTD3_9ACTN|nr:helix-turn-helix transcriptional regulator [Actinoplanes atraurantiacus]SNY74521.1 Helix-turn-helix domain-containing protein [Actinoplanes atraurantiacus]
MHRNELGIFLRGRRAAIRPDRDAPATSGYRRVPGLRREEVALLAGLSVDYYTRLEQGRERHPSAQVVAALSRAFQLTGDGRAHLFRLAGRLPAEPPPVADQVDPELAGLLQAWSATPAYIINPTMDIVAENDLAAALHAAFAEPGNLARMTFLDPVGREFYVDWDRAAHAAAAHLRLAAGHDSRDPRLVALLDELAEGSTAFRQLWERHDVRGKTREAKQFRHPDIGLITLDYETFDVRSAPGLQLIVHHAAPGSSHAQALHMLGSLAATSGARPARC